jgi:hypothetical protein
MDCTHFVTFLLCSKLFEPAATHPSSPRLRSSVGRQQRKSAVALAEFGCFGGSSAALNAYDRWSPVLGYLDAGVLIRLQSPALPVFTPLAPLPGMPDSSVDSGGLYAGETVRRISEIISAQQAVDDLAP